MSRSALADTRLDLLVRQLDYLLERGMDAAPALEQLQSTASEDLQPLARKLAEVVNRATSGITRDPGPFGPLSRAMVLAAGAQGQPEKTLVPMLRLTGELRETARRARASFYPRVLYVAFLALAGVLLSLLFSLFILPVQEGFYQTFTLHLPNYVRGLLDLGLLGHPLIFGVILLLVVVLAALAHLGTMRLAQAIPQPRSLRIVPGFRRLAEATRTHGTLALCEALMRAGAEEDWVMGEARKLVGRDRGDKTIDALEFAAANGTLEQELGHQQRANLASISTLTRHCGNASLVAIKALVFVALAHLIVSYYLPILQFGSVYVGATQ